MGRLIDTDELKESLLYEFDDLILECESYDKDAVAMAWEHIKRTTLRMIDSLPTAFNEGNVIKQLENEAMQFRHYAKEEQRSNGCTCEYARLLAKEASYENAVEIVKRGGFYADC